MPADLQMGTRHPRMTMKSVEIVLKQRSVKYVYKTDTVLV